METLAAATLAKDIPAQRAVTTIVPRQQITAILEDPDAEPELYLRITGDGLDEEDENVIGMRWSRDDLEQLLNKGEGDGVVLTFDRDELASALFDDVEAHGMRERAAVFAVVAAGALGTGAGIANAMPSGEDGGPVVTNVAPAVPTVGNAVEAQAKAATGLAHSAVNIAPAIDSTAASATGSMVTDASSTAGYTAPATESSSGGSLRTDASSSGGFGPTATTDSSGGSMLSIHEPSTTDGLLVGGVLLAIAGAAFTTRRRSGTSRPA